MAELKTRPADVSVSDFIAAIVDPEQKRDAKKLASMMCAVTGKRGRIWGTSIVGFGTYRYANTKSCLYVKRLADIDESILEELVKASVATMRARYPAD